MNAVKMLVDCTERQQNHSLTMLYRLFEPRPDPEICACGAPKPGMTACCALCALRKELLRVEGGRK